jgi:hypothetical protein
VWAVRRTGTAWAVVRTLATTPWWTAAALAATWVVLSGLDGAFQLWFAVPAVAALVAAAVLEYHAGWLHA